MQAGTTWRAGSAAAAARSVAAYVAAEAAMARSGSAAAAAQSRAAASAVPSGAAVRAASAPAAAVSASGGPARKSLEPGGDAVAVGAEAREGLRLQPGVRQAVRTAELRELRLQLSVEVHRTDIWTGFHFAANGSVAALLLLLVLCGFPSLQYVCPGDRLDSTALSLLATDTCCPKLWV